VIKEKFTLMSSDEAAAIIGSRGGASCMLAGIALAISLISMNVVAIVASVAAADQSC
jgi:hypothetical protein